MPEWVQALADGTGLPADLVAVPEGGALGSAFFARLAAGLETDATAARRWARTDRRVEPDPGLGRRLHHAATTASGSSPMPDRPRTPVLAPDPCAMTAEIGRQNEDDRLLDGRVALITGAASGQGRAAALLLRAAGRAVVVADIDDEGAAETVRHARGARGRGRAVSTPTSRSRADVDAMVAATIERYGRLDVLYNNAAVQMSGRLVDCTEDDWDLTIATNLVADLLGLPGRAPPPARR